MILITQFEVNTNYIRMSRGRPEALVFFKGPQVH